MRISKLIFICLVCLAISALGWSKIPASAFGKSQAPEVGLANKPHSLPGYLDLETGLFTTRVQTAAPAPAVATTPVIFRLIFNFNFEFNDQPSNNTLACNVFISSNEGPQESAVGLSSDGGKTCQATILANWNLATPTTDTINVGYEIMASPASSSGQPIAFPNFFFFSVSPLRDSFHWNADGFPMPANGQTITRPTFTVVI